MVIIIEGIDRVGKTTLAKGLSKQFNIPIMKLDRLGGNADMSYLCVARNEGRAIGLVEAFNKMKNDIIIDRFHMTEYVYNQIRNNGDDCGYASSFVQTEDKMVENMSNYLLIMVEPTDITLSSRENGEDLSKHLEIFNKLYNSTYLNKIKCDYNTLDRAVDIVNDILDCRRKVSFKQQDIKMIMNENLLERLSKWEMLEEEK